MVPTELLAIQHFQHLHNLLENLGEVERIPTVALLTGSTPLKQSRLIRKVWMFNSLLLENSYHYFAHKFDS